MLQHYSLGEQKLLETSISKRPLDSLITKTHDEPSFSQLQSYEAESEKREKVNQNDLMERINKLLELHQYQPIPYSARDLENDVSFWSDNEN